MNIIKEFRNDLLKRKELIVKNNYNSNPGFSQSVKDIVAEFGVGEEVVVVRRVGSEFGNNEFVIDVFIYDSVGDKDKIELKKNKVKDGKEKKGK